MTSKVQLYIYDISMGIAAQLSPLFLGKKIDGIWHTGVVVYGREYYYGGMGGIEWCHPGGLILGQPLKIMDMGETHIPLDTFEEFLRGQRERFSPDCYNLLDHNCNNFSNEVVQFLTGKPIPEYIIELPREALSSPMGKQIIPFLQVLDPSVNESSVAKKFGQPKPTSAAQVEQPTPKTALPAGTEPVLQDPVLLPLDFDLRLSLVMTALKEIAGGLAVDQKLLQELSAAPSLQANPSAAISLAVSLSRSFSCMMEPPPAAEALAKYFVVFTSSTDLMLSLSKNTDDIAELVSKLTLCSIDAGMVDNKTSVLRLVGTALANCLYHESVRAVIADQYEQLIQSTANMYLLRSDPDIEISSALILNVSYLSELSEEQLEELVPALLEFIQPLLDNDSFSDQHALWCVTALLKFLRQSPEMLEVAKAMNVDLTKLKSRPSDLLRKSCTRYELIISD